MIPVCEITPFLLSPLRHRASLHVILAPARTPRIRHTFFHQDGRRSVHSGFSPRAPRQQLILAPLPLYVEMGYSVQQLGTFGRVRQGSREEFANNGWGSSFVLAA